MNCGGCGRYMSCRPEETVAGEILCARCWFKQEAGDGLPGWRMMVAWIGWGLTSALCFLLSALYYAGTGRAKWALLLIIVLLVSVSLPALSWIAGKRNWKLLGALFWVPMGGWFLLWKAVPGVGWSGSSLTLGAGIFLIALGVTLFFLFIREMARIPRA